MNNDFYLIESANKRGAIRIEPTIEYDGLSMLDKTSPLILNNHFIIASGNISYDLLEFADSSFFAISEKFRSILELNKVEGWNCFPIRIENLDDKYFGIYIESQAGPILNLNEVNNFEVEHCEFDESSWDGCDIFTLKDTLLVVCSEKVKDLLEFNKLSNVRFSPL